MIVPPTSVRVLVATRPVDFRKGMDGLAALVQEELRADPFCGVIYVFRAKRADRGSCAPQRSTHAVDALKIGLRIGNELPVGRMIHGLDADDFRAECVTMFFDVAEELELRRRWAYQKNLVTALQ